jgi:hypothetical protein
VLSLDDLSLLRTLQVGDTPISPENVNAYAMTSSVAFAEDGITLVTSAIDAGKTPWVQTWDAETGVERARLTLPRGRVGRVAVSRDGRTIAMAAFDGLYFGPVA